MTAVAVPLAKGNHREFHPGALTSPSPSFARRGDFSNTLIDLVGFRQALHEIGYAGPVEPSVVGCPYLDAMPTLEAARTNSRALEELFRKAGITEE